MFSQTIEYALRALFCLALDFEHAHTTKYLAREMDIPPSYLAKIMQNVTKAGIVTSQRGVHGGFKLVRSPTEVTLASIIDAVDPISLVCECPQSVCNHKGKLCPLHRRMNDAISMTLNLFEKTTLGDLLDETE